MITFDDPAYSVKNQALGAKCPGGEMSRGKQTKGKTSINQISWYNNRAN